MRVPPWWVRRPLVGAVLGLAAWGVTRLPLWAVPALVLAALVLPRGARLPRVLVMALAYLTVEVLAAALAAVLWVLRPVLRTERSRTVHYRALRLALSLLVRLAATLFRVRIVDDGPSWSPLDDGAPGSENAMVVLGRHAGPGDSFLLVNTLMNRDHRRRPRIVLKETLALDPMIDVYLSRLPSRFVPVKAPPGRDVAAQVGALAADLGPEDALLIFPEGGNWTPRRRRRAIERLREQGHSAHADRAEAMRHVLAPRPGGVTAALQAAPSADVVLVAHTGLEHLSGLRDVWRALPGEHLLRMRWWFVPAAEVPREPDALVEWLYDRWEEVDAWIADHGGRVEAGPRDRPVAF